MLTMNKTSKRTLSHDNEDEMLTRSGPLSQSSQEFFLLWRPLVLSSPPTCPGPPAFVFDLVLVLTCHGHWDRSPRPLPRLIPSTSVAPPLCPVLLATSEASASAAGSVEPASSYQEGSIVRARLYHIQWVDHTPR